MDYKLLNDGKTKISRLSIGTWAFSNAELWGDCDQNAAHETVHRALDCGINLFDTAEKYGGEALFRFDGGEDTFTVRIRLNRNPEMLEER